ncbi:MAG: TIGR00282 family metallophosphoesterase [Candidatus Pacebacteria bacterium]|nr:TIGR00282 family metallophosphoesterase [Candidatus Paceibacterota bacterium]
MRILFLGDMVGKPARAAVAKFIAEKKSEMGVDVVIANSDNLAHGRSVTRKTVEEMLSSGVDIMTCGDHAWDNTQAFDILQAGDLDFICPCNLPGLDSGLSGKIFEKMGTKILVINLIGRVFIDKELTSPFDAVTEILRHNEKEERVKIIIVDFHAETTSEKKALGRFLRGKVSAVLGTHTHVQTADEELLGDYTAYITDVGMVGVEDSILGCDEKAVLEQYVSGAPFKYKLAEDNRVMIQGVLLDIDEKSGKTMKIERVQEGILPEV